MNSTEKKFAVNRVFNLLNNKLKELAEEDCEERGRERKKGAIPIATVIKSIADGSIKPRKKLKDITIGSSLSSIYNTDALQKSYNKKLKFLDRLAGSDSLTMRNPSNNDYGSYHPFYYADYHTRGKKVIAKFQSIVDEIMLGDNDKALALIRSIEKMKF